MVLKTFTPYGDKISGEIMFDMNMELNTTGADGLTTYALTGLVARAMLDVL